MSVRKVNYTTVGVAVAIAAEDGRVREMSSTPQTPQAFKPASLLARVPEQNVLARMFPREGHVHKLTLPHSSGSVSRTGNSRNHRIQVADFAIGTTING